MWKISLDENNLVDGFYPSDYRGTLPTTTLIEVDDEEYQHVFKIMPAQYIEGEGFIPWTPSFTLDDFKKQKHSILDDSFNTCVEGSFITSQGYLMQFDTSDSLKMQGAITLMEALGSSTGYLTQANDITIYNVPIETMKQVLVEMLSAYAKCHARKQELRTLINNAQTKEELDEIVISWPI